MPCISGKGVQASDVAPERGRSLSIALYNHKAEGEMGEEKAQLFCRTLRSELAVWSPGYPTVVAEVA